MKGNQLGAQLDVSEQLGLAVIPLRRHAAHAARAAQGIGVLEARQLVEGHVSDQDVGDQAERQDQGRLQQRNEGAADGIEISISIGKGSGAAGTGFEIHLVEGPGVGGELVVAVVPLHAGLEQEDAVRIDSAQEVLHLVAARLAVADQRRSGVGLQPVSGEADAAQPREVIDDAEAHLGIELRVQPAIADRSVGGAGAGAIDRAIAEAIVTEDLPGIGRADLEAQRAAEEARHRQLEEEILHRQFDSAAAALEGHEPGGFEVEDIRVVALLQAHQAREEPAADADVGAAADERDQVQLVVRLGLGRAVGAGLVAGVQRIGGPRRSRGKQGQRAEKARQRFAADPRCPRGINVHYRPAGPAFPET